MQIHHIAKLVSLILLVLITQVACGINEDAFDRIERTGEIRIFNNLAAPPWQFRDVNNYPTGVTVDINRMIAADLGVDLQLTDVDFSGLIPSLLARKTDILATTLSTTPKRASKIWFTDENWHEASVVAYVPEQSTISSWLDLNNENITLAAVSGTASSDIINGLFPDANRLLYGLDVDAFQALKTGRVNAVLNDSVFKRLVREEYNFVTIHEPNEVIMSDPWAFAVRLEEEKIWNYLNSFARKIRANGKLDALKKYWLVEEIWKKDFLEKNNGVSSERRELVNQLGIADYTSYVGDINRLKQN